MHKGRDDLISPEEAEKGVEIVSKICGIDKEKINYPTVECNGVSINEQEFDLFPRELLDIDFKYEIKFTNCKFGCLEYFCLYKTNNSFLIFENCEFDYICLNNDLVTDNVFELNNKLYFFGCKFNGGIDIGQANISGEIRFNGCAFKEVFCFDIKEYLANIKIKNCIFYKSFFMLGSFKNEARFDNSIFKDYVDFHECEFEKTACFYGVTFDKTPNFSACYFKEPKAVNLINVDIDKLDFKSVEKYIEDNYEDESCKNETKGMQNEKEIFKIQNKHKLRYAKNLKDSFRVLKDILTTQNNILEAQEWHKLELYVKEKELEIQLDNNKNCNLQKEYENQIYNPKDYEKVDSSRIIPIFMHLLKVAGHLFLNILIFIELILVVPFFAVMFYCVYIGLFMYKILVFILKSSYPLNINKFKIFWKIKLNRIVRKLAVSGRKMLDYTLWFDCVLLQVYRNTSNHHTNFLKILNFTILMISLYAFMGFVFSKTINFISSFNSVSIIIANYFILFALIMVFFNVKRQLHHQGSILFFGIFGTFIILMMSFLSPVYIPTFCFLIYFASILFFYLLFLCEIKLFVFILRLVTYGCLIVVIISKPQFISPFTGVFSSDKLYESQFEKSLNDLNASAIINLASISQNDFNLHLKDQNISFIELNSAKASIIANKENLLELNDANSNIAKEVLGEKYTELLKTINQDKIAENTIKSTSVLYSIILLLCIFSLQKTARKNSIVPS